MESKKYKVFHETIKPDLKDEFVECGIILHHFRKKLTTFQNNSKYKIHEVLNFKIWLISRRVTRCETWITPIKQIGNGETQYIHSFIEIRSYNKLRTVRRDREPWKVQSELQLRLYRDSVFRGST